MEVHELLGLKNEAELVPWVGGIVKRTLKNVPSYAYEFEEMLSIGLLAVVEGLKRYDPERRKTFRAFLAIKVRGALLDEVRRMVRNKPLRETITFEDEAPLEERIVSRDTPETEFLRKERDTALVKEVEKLAETEKSVVLEFSVLDRKTMEIAESHGRTTRGFASKALKRATAKLREPLLEAGVDSMRVAA